MRIEGKSALVTGAGSGIGRAIALALAEKGARLIVLCDLDGEGLAQTTTLVRGSGAAVDAIRIDVTNLAEFAGAIAGVDDGKGPAILVNNAGIVAGSPGYPETPADRLAKVFATNLVAVAAGTAAAARAMSAQGGGVVINISSTTATQPRLDDAPYRAAKAGVNMLTQCCRELSAQGVRVNAVAPGITDTPILGHAGDRPESRAWLESAMQRVAVLSPRDIAAAVISLIEDDRAAGEILAVENIPRATP